MSEILQYVANGTAIVFSIHNLLLIVLGVVVGLVAGSIPGLNAGNTCAMMLPITLAFTVDGALVFIVSVYMAVQYGGSISAILINTPGASGAMATLLDGFPMCQHGKPAQALGISLGASTFGGLVAIVVCIVVLQPISRYALNFRTVDIFLLALIGISVIIVISEKDPLKGGLAGAMGLLIAAIGAEPTYGSTRLTFGFFELYEGIPMVACMCGVFAFPAMIKLIGGKGISNMGAGIEVGFKGIIEGVKISLRYPIALIRSSLIGLFVGIIPGAGVNAAALMSYSQAQTWSKNRDNFGKGEPEGIIASEAANNAVAAGACVPALTIGIPGSNTAAVLLAALTLKGITPGPRIMQDYTNEVYSVFIALLVSTALMFVLGAIYTALASHIVKVDLSYMVPAVMLICIVGSYATRGLLFDAYLFIIFGVLGYLMVASGYQYAPLVLGIVMGPIAETNFAIAMNLSGGTYGIMFETAISRLIWIILALTLLGPTLMKRMKKHSGNKAA